MWYILELRHKRGLMRITQRINKFHAPANRQSRVSADAASEAAYRHRAINNLQIFSSELCSLVQTYFS